MKKILLLATGGTIASKPTAAGGLAPAITSEELLSFVPELAKLCEIDAVQLFSLDSTNVGPEQWQQLVHAIRQNYDAYDGFVIAQKDLEIRGPGELLGTRQTGNAEFKVADLLRDQAMIPDVQRIARHIHERYPLQAQALIERWMPETERYSNA